MKQSSFYVNENLQFSMDDRVSGINSNIVLMGEPGCGKTSIMGYNLMHMLDHSHVVIDIKNRLSALAPYFKENGYKVYHFDLIDLENSDHYNPFQFIQDDEKKIENLSTIANYIIGDDYSEKDGYWESAARLIVNAALQYTYDSLSPKHRFMNNSLRLLQLSNTKGKPKPSRGVFFTNNVEDPFKYLLEMNDLSLGETSHASLLYSLAMNNAIETMACVQNNLHTHLYRFYTPSIMRIFSKNGIDFNSFLKQKTIVFIGLKDYDTTLHSLCEIFLTQLFQFLFRSADQFKDGRLPFPIQFWLDDFGSYKISDFASLIANGRSRGIAMTLGFHSLGQLYKIYGIYNTQTILQCASTMLFFGSDDLEGVKLVQSKTGFESSYINDLPRGNVIFMQRGKKSIVAPVYDISKEPQYCYWNYSNEKSKSKKPLVLKEATKSSVDIEKKIIDAQSYKEEKYWPFSLDELHALNNYLDKLEEKIDGLYDNFERLDIRGVFDYNRFGLLEGPPLDRKNSSFEKFHKKAGQIKAVLEEFDSACFNLEEHVRKSISLYDLLPQNRKTKEDEYLIETIMIKRVIRLEKDLEKRVFLEKEALIKEIECYEAATR